jgi:hypothetical protein
MQASRAYTPTHPSSSSALNPPTDKALNNSCLSSTKSHFSKQQGKSLDHPTFPWLAKWGPVESANLPFGFQVDEMPGKKGLGASGGEHGC